MIEDAFRLRNSNANIPNKDSLTDGDEVERYFELPLLLLGRLIIIVPTVVVWFVLAYIHIYGFKAPSNSRLAVKGRHKALVQDDSDGINDLRCFICLLFFAFSGMYNTTYVGM